MSLSPNHSSPPPRLSYHTTTSLNRLATITTSLPQHITPIPATALNIFPNIDSHNVCTNYTITIHRIERLALKSKNMYRVNKYILFEKIVCCAYFFFIPISEVPF